MNIWVPWLILSAMYAVLFIWVWCSDAQMAKQRQQVDVWINKEWRTALAKLIKEKEDSDFHIKHDIY
jgi:hypothetical protein